ncbi:hypothetical protein HY212_06690 [Candidatus Pacearchaeota archaeon]|nr:hypothetical protein [Candidatus Pacearchaeota archaeon]
MEIVTMPKSKFERMKAELKRLKELEQVDFELVRQFKEGLEDLKAGRVKRVA